MQDYVNRGSVTNVQVDAYRFLNEGEFITTPFVVPWDSQNTTNFVNRGIMSGNIGFRFETVDPTFGFRRPADRFINDGQIFGVDSGGLLPFDSAGTFVSAFFNPDFSAITVNARNITNRGDISVGAAGVLRLTGRDVDLTAGTLFVEDVNSSISSGFSSFIIDVTGTNFFPSPGVYDQAWSVDSLTNMTVNSLIRNVNPNIILTPPFRLTNAIGFFCTGLQLITSNALTFTRDATLSETNRVIQVIAVDTSDTNINVSASFLPFVFPDGSPQSGYLSPIVEFRVASTNFRTLELQTNSLYFIDQLGSHTNYGLSLNLAAGTLRPAPFLVFRSGPGLGEAGAPGVTTLSPSIFTFDQATGTRYSNNIVTNIYAAYAMQAESLARRVPSLPDVGVTNFPGRLEVKADQLTLNNTRMRGEGLISLSATNMTPGSGVFLDVPRLNMNFNTKSNLLRIPDMTPDSVERFGGYLQAYSAAWTNFFGAVQGTNTNTVEVHFELLVLDAKGLHTREPVVAYELKLSSTNGGNGTLIYEDNIAVTNLLELHANNLTFSEDSRLYLGKGVGFSYTNVFEVDVFTNLGTLQINELADFSKTQDTGYSRFINRGSISAFGENIRADYFESTGDISTFVSYGSVPDPTSLLDVDCFGVPFTFITSGPTIGSINIDAGTAKVDGGQFSAGGDIRFSGQILKANNHQASAGATMFFNVADILTDSGADAGNRWNVEKGFDMSGVRPSGDLLGTEITSHVRALGVVNHTWSAEDRGPTVAGFQNNVALGRLTVDGERFSIFNFGQGVPGSALYVDVLEIEGVQAQSFSELTNRIKLGMNVYYGDAFSRSNANFTAETLNRVFGPSAPFNFYWVTNWAGPNSSVDVPLTVNGPVKPFNRALRLSKNIDSDGDGLPNFFDPFPFPPEEFIISGITVSEENGAVSVGFNTTQGARYIIEYTTDLLKPDWKQLSEILQSNSNGGILKFTDQVQAGHPQRFYRVRKAQ